MDLRKLKTLIDLVSESDISELEITEAEGKVRIVKAGAAQPVVYAQAPAAAPAVTAVAAPAAAAPVAEVAAAPTGHTVKSPMVGTFYGASSPGAAPFVAVGTAVKKGQTVCIIEAMKLLNEIEADADGVITQILVQNGDPVEFGQPLFIIG
ncbi:MAG: acetyl-CoA carboxylase biotin carboxyl carrier protein [Formosimonas sp.]